MSLFNFDYRASKLVLASAALALAGGVIGAGCGGADLSTQAGFCQALAQADCSYAVVQACYGSDDASLEQDTNSCIAERSKPEKCNPGNLPYHSDFAENCIAAHTNVYANESFNRETYDSLREACLAAFNRGGQKGQACADDSDCEVGGELRCVVRFGGNGSCQIPIPVAGGESCKAPANVCPGNQYCDEGFHCVARGSAGDDCGAGQPCGTGFRCNELAGKCEGQYANNDNCKLDSDCSGGFCIATAASSGSEGLCTSTFQFSWGTSTCLNFTR